MTFNADIQEIELTTGKTAILSTYAQVGTSGDSNYEAAGWRSYVSTKAGKKPHALGNGEAYYRVFKVTITSNYSTVRDTNGELDYELSNSSGSYYGKKYHLEFTAKAIAADTITHAASFFVLDAAPTTLTDAIPNAVTSIDIPLNGYTGTAVEKWLVVFVDGASGTHSGTVKAGVEGAASIANVAVGG